MSERGVHMIGSVFLDETAQSIRMQFFNLITGHSCSFFGIGAAN